ncbi:MAG: F0F1 ATP synthase subunit delta [Patescibacteria group bacterium]
MKKTPRLYAKQLVVQALKQPSKLETIVSDFWLMVLKNKHFGWRKRIIQEIDQIWHESTGEPQVEVITGRELKPDEQQVIKEQLEQISPTKMFTITWLTKPHLLGGVVVTINGVRFDLSLKGKIDKLYYQLAN